MHLGKKKRKQYSYVYVYVQYVKNKQSVRYSLYLETKKSLLRNYF